MRPRLNHLEKNILLKHKHKIFAVNPCYIMDLALTPQKWDPSFPDLPVSIGKHGFVFVRAVGKFYCIGGTTPSGSSAAVYSIQYPGPTTWTAAG